MSFDPNDPFRIGTEWDTADTYVRACRTLAERNGFKMQRRTQVNVKVKVFCTHTHGANKCSFHTILRKIRAEEIVDNEWFVAETNLEHSGHLPTAIDPRQMVKEEERDLQIHFAALKTSPTTPNRVPVASTSSSTARTSSSQSTQVYVHSEKDSATSPSRSIGPTDTEFSHLSASSSISNLTRTLKLDETASACLFNEGAETIEDLIWLSPQEILEICSPLKKVHALRIVSACRVLDARLGKEIRAERRRSEEVVD